MKRAFLAAVVVLAACGHEPEDQPPAQDTAPPVSTPVDTTPPTASGFGASGEWVVTPVQVGPIRLGVSLAEALPLLREPVDTAMISDGCEYVTPRDAPPDLGLMVESRRIVRADVMGGSVSTAEGAKIGDTEERILELYPSARREPHAYTDGSYLVVLPFAPGDTIYRYVFETDGTRVTAYRGGLYPPVGYVEGCS